MTRTYSIDMSWLVGVAICGLLAFGVHSCTADDASARAENSYRECIRTAQTIALAGGHLDCKAPTQ